VANSPENPSDLDYTDTLWQAADKVRGTVDAAEYKHVVLGLLFLRYVSDSFEFRRVKLREELEKDGIKGHRLERLRENRDDYTAQRVSWVPPEARWQTLQNQATRPDIATLAHMNLALHRIEANLGAQPADTFLRDLHPDLKADYIIAKSPVQRVRLVRSTAGSDGRSETPPEASSLGLWNPTPRRRSRYSESAMMTAFNAIRAFV
jgi:type I restriction-modification system DNA methylase subunit